MGPNFLSLPTELLIQILSPVQQIYTQEDHWSITQTCRTLYDIVMIFRHHWLELIDIRLDDSILSIFRKLLVRPEPLLQDRVLDIVLVNLTEDHNEWEKWSDAIYDPTVMVQEELQTYNISKYGNLPAYDEGYYYDDFTTSLLCIMTNGCPNLTELTINFVPQCFVVYVARFGFPPGLQNLLSLKIDGSISTPPVSDILSIYPFFQSKSLREVTLINIKSEVNCNYLADLVDAEVPSSTWKHSAIEKLEFIS